MGFDLVNEEIKHLRFQLKETEDKLKEIDVRTFTYNEQISLLIDEISALKERIKAKEENNNE